MARKVAVAFSGVLRARRSRVGLTFKPNTDDMREAPSIPLSSLQDMGAKVRVHGPRACSRRGRCSPG
jgi:UDPglucose 6-dehydrogenase